MRETSMRESTEDAVINTETEEAIRAWCEQFNCTEAMLNDALQEAGRSRHSVQRYLQVRCHEEPY